MSGLADYVGYCTLKCEVDFTSTSSNRGAKLNKAVITIATQGVIWGIYPSDASGGKPADAFCITSSPNVNNDPTTAVPLASLSVKNQLTGSYLTIDYDPSLTQGSSKFYFNAYLWGNASAIQFSNVTLHPQLNGNATLIVNGTNLHKQGPVSVKWMKNKVS